MTKKEDIIYSEEFLTNGELITFRYPITKKKVTKYRDKMKDIEILKEYGITFDNDYFSRRFEIDGMFGTYMVSMLRGIAFSDVSNKAIKVAMRKGLDNLYDAYGNDYREIHDDYDNMYYVEGLYEGLISGKYKIKKI